MRFAFVALVALLGVLHAELWFGKGGWPRVLQLRTELAAQQEKNALARSRNEQLAAEVRDLREGLETAEEIARTELGMIKPDEIFVQISATR